MDLNWIPTLVSAVGTIVAAYFAYNQYAKNKLTDLKIEKWKKEEEDKNAERSSHIARIYGELWELLHYLKADRVYILQPHPLVNSMFISISLEVKRNGIAGMKEVIHNLPMSNFAGFIGDISTRDFIFYKSVETDMSDKRAKAYAMMHGTKSIMIKSLSDDGKRWIGSIFLDFTTELTNVNIDYIKSEINEAAINIQYVLPELKKDEL